MENGNADRKGTMRLGVESCGELIELSSEQSVEVTSYLRKDYTSVLCSSSSMFPSLSSQVTVYNSLTTM